MADGGNENPQSCSTDISPQLNSLECTICLAKIRQRRLLPCLHSVCTDCLNTYITKELLSDKKGLPSCFPCPVCGRIIHPMNQSEDIQVWAQQFPVISKAVESLVIQQQTRFPSFCIPCRLKFGKDVPATFWCKTNKTFFCTTCKVNFHDYVHTQCDVIEIVNGKLPVVPKETVQLMCAMHKKYMDFYCQDHHLLCCGNCIAVEHRRCRTVTTIEDYVRKLSGTSQLNTIIESLKQGANAMGSLVADFKAQLETLVQDKEVALKSITDLRGRIDECLDKMQQEVTNELMIKIKEVTNDLDISRHKCERQQGKIQSIFESLKTANDNDRHLETILLYREGKVDISSCKDIAKKVMRSFMSMHIKHVFTFDPAMERRKVLLNMGEIVVQKTSRSLQCSLGIFTPMSERNVEEIGRIKIQSRTDHSDCCSCGIVYLTGGFIVLSDLNNHKLKLFSETGKRLHELDVPNYPLDICMVDKSTVAVLSKDPNIVRLVKVISCKLVLVSEITGPEGSCWGITYAEGNFIVSSNGMVYNMTKRGRVDVIHRSTTKCLHLAYDSKKRRILSSSVSSTAGDTAISTWKGGSVKEMLKVGVVKCALGVDVDEESNIYVCGRDSNNIVQISADGTHVRELLTSSDGIEKPRAISVCDDKFVVTNESIKNSNYINLYKLV